MRLELPWPPSVNHYWRYVVRGKRIVVHISKEGQSYRRNVEAALFGNKIDTFEGPLRITIVLRPPDRRRRDLDNCLKALLDAMEHCRVFLNDSQVWQLSIAWDLGETGRIIVQSNGLAVVTIEPLELAPTLFDQNEMNP